ncbi:hypothetical protein C8A05DRAFT_45826 [Staphylotrichum tortipilum]|uniref:Uncharacterized protein n=1 Tax=Staphylotrichum tortipilum TaxID=2831512 RepID=A0AAN6MHG9_9PEZI|nr:hypothetical protein C8A05DRAFT_45826 [Staphylotrichum longicolle]
MAGGFDPVDPARCKHYAAFAAHLDRRSFDFLYWFLFATVIAMLFLASWRYSRALESINTHSHPPSSPAYRRTMTRCMAVCGAYAAVAVVAVVMEVYALMALQFCDGEDLMPLYWSTWAMMQVGSVMAIFGVVMAGWNGVRGGGPPWALALGTPVLVVAGIGHAVHGAVRKRVRSRSSSRFRIAGGGRQAEASLPPMSRDLTLRAEDSEREDGEIPARFVGFTASGAPVVKFAEGLPPGVGEGERGVVVGRGEDGGVVVAFHGAPGGGGVDGEGCVNGVGDGTVVLGGSSSARPVDVGEDVSGNLTHNGLGTAVDGPVVQRGPVVRVMSPPGVNGG